MQKKKWSLSAQKNIIKKQFKLLLRKKNYICSSIAIIGLLGLLLLLYIIAK